MRDHAEKWRNFNVMRDVDHRGIKGIVESRKKRRIVPRGI